MASSLDAREYLLSHGLQADRESTIGKVTVRLYARREGGDVLEVHRLSGSQWQLKGDEGQRGMLRAFIDTQLPQPLWAEISVDDETLATRAELNAPGDMTAEGEIYSKSGFRFPDNSVQTSAANTQALDKVLGGSSSCPVGSSIRAIDAGGNVTCEADDGGGSGTVTQVNTGAGLTGGPITASGTISIASGGIGANEIDSNQVQRRVSGSCPNGYMMTGINADGSLQCVSLYDLLPLPPRSFTVDSADNVGWHTSLVLDASGNPVISYYDLSNHDLKLTHCNDPYCSGGNESIAILDSVGDVGQFTSLALDAAGYPIVSYFDVTNQNLKLVRCISLDCSGFKSTVTVDNAGNVGGYSSLVLDASGNPIISYHDSTNHDLKLVHCNDQSCNGGNESIVTVDSGGSVGEYTSLVLDSSGYPVISYTDDTGLEDLKLVHCNDPNCSGQNESIATVDTSGGSSTSLVLDASGYPVISYYANGRLTLAHCNDVNCNGGGESIRTVDNDGGYTTYSSLVLDVYGRPVISYYDDTNENLKLVHCNDPDCKDNDESIVTVDSAGSVGAFSSLMLDASGRPVISYFDGTNGDLKLVKCGTPDCQ